MLAWGMLFGDAAANLSTNHIQIFSVGMEKPALYTGVLSDDLVFDPLEVHFIDVGSADAILLRAGMHTLLVDCGTENRAEEIIAYLQSIGVKQLTYAFGSHPHDDHIGGFPGLMNKISVGEYLDPNLFEEEKNPFIKRLSESLEKHSIPKRRVEDGQILRLGAAELRFIQWENPSARINNRSMVIHVQCGDRTMLLAADIEEHAQIALATRYGEELRADILKFPHHGLAGYTQEFHFAVQPSLVIISNTTKSAKKTVSVLDDRDVFWMVTTKGTIIAVTEGSVWRIWQERKQ